MVSLAEEYDVPARTCLRGTGLDEANLDGPEAIVSRRQELAVIANLLEATGDPPSMGVEAGLRYHLTTYGIWGFAMISSPTLRSAIAVGLQFLDLTFAFCRITLHENGDEARLVLDAPDVPEPIRRFVVDRDLTAVAVIQREVSGAALPLRHLSMAFIPRAGHEQRISRFTEVFGVPPVPGGSTYFTFDRALLDMPLPQGDPRTAADARAQCHALLESRRTRSSRADPVRDHIMARLSSGAHMAEVAADLHVSARSLQRHLAAEGTSYRALLQEVRQGLARDLLEDGRAVAEVAQRLGYTEVSSFSQAFRRWEGNSPRAHRRHAG